MECAAVQKGPGHALMVLGNILRCLVECSRPTHIVPTAGCHSTLTRVFGFHHQIHTQLNEEAVWYALCKGKASSNAWTGLSDNSDFHIGYCKKRDFPLTQAEFSGHYVPEIY